MTNRIKSVLSRVLSEELGNQEKWMNKDAERGFDAQDRYDVIQEIQQFMRDNQIEVRTDYYLEGLHS